MEKDRANEEQKAMNKHELPDEALDQVSGGAGGKFERTCAKCGQIMMTRTTVVRTMGGETAYQLRSTCENCGISKTELIPE